MDGVAAAVAGHSSLLVLFHSHPDAALKARVESAGAERPPATPRRHRIDVRFTPADGPDLETFLGARGLDLDRLIDEVTALELRARFNGFRPGFAYLEGLPPAWHMPRRSTIRSDVPAGSFAIGGEMAAFYPSRSPGGWNLLGRSDALFWDPRRDPPNLLAPGDLVEIVPVTRPLAERRAAADAGGEGEIVAEVVREPSGGWIVGAPALHRYGWGAPPGGAFDEEAALAANRAVGNPDAAPVLEIAASGPELHFVAGAILSWQGAPAPVEIDGFPARGPLFEISPGARLRVGAFTAGARGVLAIRGGWVAPGEPDGLPRPVRRRQCLRRGDAPTVAPRIRRVERATPSFVEAFEGPHSLPAGLRDHLLAHSWTVSARSDRAAVRFTAGGEVPALPASLRSDPMQRGTVQWHPDGDLIAMGPDHPVTGGYLQAMTVRQAELWKLAQLAPGDRIRWKLVQ